MQEFDEIPRILKYVCLNDAHYTASARNRDHTGKINLDGAYSIGTIIEDSFQGTSYLERCRDGMVKEAYNIFQGQLKEQVYLCLVLSRNTHPAILEVPPAYYSYDIANFKRKLTVPIKKDSLDGSDTFETVDAVIIPITEFGRDTILAYISPLYFWIMTHWLRITHCGVSLIDINRNEKQTSLYKKICSWASFKEGYQKKHPLPHGYAPTNHATPETIYNCIQGIKETLIEETTGKRNTKSSGELALSYAKSLRAIPRVDYSKLSLSREAQVSFSAEDLIRHVENKWK